MLFQAALPLALVLGIIADLQHTRANNNSTTNNVILTQTNIVFLQYHRIRLKNGSSDSRCKNALYTSGIPAPGRNSALCSSITFKQAVGRADSVYPLNFRFRVCDSDTYPATRGMILKNVNNRRSGLLLNSSMHGWLKLARDLPFSDTKSTLTCRK